MSPDEPEDQNTPLTDADEASGAGYGNNAEEQTGSTPGEEDEA